MLHAIPAARLHHGSPPGVLTLSFSWLRLLSQVPAVEDVTRGFTLLHGDKVRLTWSVNAPTITLTASSTKKSDWLR